MKKTSKLDPIEIALKCAKGYYQRGIITGEYRLSGSDLRGKARKYSGAYARSRANLLERVRAAGVQVGERKGEHGLRILVLA